MKTTEVELEVQENNNFEFKNKEIEEIDFKDEIRKDATVLAAYYYIKQLYNNGLLSEKELRVIKEKYHIDIE